MKSLKLKDDPGENFTDFCDAILVDADRLESAGSFNHQKLGYIIRLFQGNSDSRFHLWVTQKYKEVIEFIKKLFVSDEYFMQLDDIITNGSLVQKYIGEYHKIVDSKQWEPSDSKKIVM